MLTPSGTFGKPHLIAFQGEKRLRLFMLNTWYPTKLKGPTYFRYGSRYGYEGRAPTATTYGKAVARAYTGRER
jgi:hypothetical protein